MAKRQGLSKRVRFAVFARDGFTCRYCGRQPGDVKLVVDHIIPVAENGTNDPENLITSCESCNQGKAAKVIAQMAPTELDRLRMAQEFEEQRAAAEHARATVQNREKFNDEILHLWCSIRGTEDADKRTIRVIASYAREHGVALVAEWIEKAHARLPHAADYRLGFYISGIRRRFTGRVQTCKYCGNEIVLEPNQDTSLEWVHTKCEQRAIANATAQLEGE